MSVARVLSRAQLGLDAPLVQVEVHLGAGLPAFTVVGLPAPVVRESRERVRAALLNSGYEFPCRRITVNLAPVELSKQGGRFDLPIALGVLIASGQLRPDGARIIECYGELGLNGELRPVGALFLAALHAQHVRHALIVPRGNAAEVSLSGHATVYAVAHLRAAAAVLRGREPQLREALFAAPSVPSEGAEPGVRGAGGVPGAHGVCGACGVLERRERAPALTDVIGQWQAKRALTVAAAGSHALLMVGPPGSGKSLLATCLPALLPPLSQGEALEVASILTLSGLTLDPRRWRERPFRAPHHTSSANALVGGGPALRPGEISLAHQGVLFLDELPEFDRRVLEALREPLESGGITLARAAGRLQLPARFQLVAAMNPCPCGYLGDARVPCRCSPARLSRYRERVSGPLLDRIDIRITVARLPVAELAQAAGTSPAKPAIAASPAIGAASGEGILGAGRGARRDPCDPCDARDPQDPRAQVQAARTRRLERSGALCAHLPLAELRRCCALAAPAARLLHRSCQRLALSGRGVQRLLALARTIADLADSDAIEPMHLAEAIQLHRPLSGPEPER